MRLVFGECEFDTGQRIVLRHGQVIPLSAKGLQLLELLIDRRPEAVAKDDILERLWPGTFVSDASLYNVVNEVRAALGDTPQAGRYIRTLPRFGYAFRAEARPAPARSRLSPRRTTMTAERVSRKVGRSHRAEDRTDKDTKRRRRIEGVAAHIPTDSDELAKDECPSLGELRSVE